MDERVFNQGDRRHRRAIRVVAFETLFQLDMRGESDLDDIRRAVIERRAAPGIEGADDASIGEHELAHVELSDDEMNAGVELGLAAHRDRRAADQAVRELAPTWPAHRQPAVDRALLRLAHYEMTSGLTPPKVAVNEALELVKRYSTERSPAFLNGVLDKILKRVLGHDAAASPTPDDDEESHQADSERARADVVIEVKTPPRSSNETV